MNIYLDENKFLELYFYPALFLISFSNTTAHYEWRTTTDRTVSLDKETK